MATTPRAPKPEPTLADGVTANGPEVSPQDPGRLQPNETVSGPLSTNPPRGPGEPAANTVADEPAAKALQEHIQGVIDSEEARGWRGARKSKATPNKNYTLAGVNAGLPTPETTVFTPSGE